MESFPYVKVLFYEELKRDPAGLVREILTFIGADPTVPVDTSARYNLSGTPRSGLIQKMITHESSFKKLVRPLVRATLAKTRREQLRKYLKDRNLKDRPVIQKVDREYLIEQYGEDIARLGQLLGKDLSYWLR